jgi:phosphoribosyl-dephospho-CoA transferase
VKYLCVGLEEAMPAGRLLDFDVEGRDGPADRESFGLPARSCLVCGAPASVCSGRRVHDDAAVNRAFLRLFELIPA